MDSSRALRAVCLAALALGTGCIQPAQSASLTMGNLLISDQATPGRIREFTPSGGLVQTFAVPILSMTDNASRDLVVDLNGNIQLYHGTFNTVLTTIDPSTGTASNHAGPAGWTTVGNGTFGGIAAFGDVVFATDMATAGAGAPNGLIRLNVNDFSTLRFASGPFHGSGDYIDVTIGRDGLLYGLLDGSAGQVNVFDPTTLAFQRQLNLNHNLRAIAVDQNGDIFAVNFADPTIYQFNGNGALQKTLATTFVGFSDIDIDGAGGLLIPSGGHLVLTDRSLSGYTTLDVGTTSISVTFAAFVQSPPGPVAVPEPGSLTLLAVGAAGLAGYAWRRRKASA